jgi:hypothetical protein
MSWIFADSPNVAVLTSKVIASGEAWIAYVSHDADDGGWQFHGAVPTSEMDAAVISLNAALEIDPSIAKLADLPLGWCARRSALDEGWQRQEIASAH